jgi:hypothetical protein
MFSYKDDINKDAQFKTLEEWLEITHGWNDPYPLPQIEEHHGVKVVREDAAGSTKQRALSFLFSHIKQDTVAYVAPREGYAPYAVLKTANEHGKKVKMFFPSSKRMSETQALLFEHGLTQEDAHFQRIAAMPVLNRVAKKWAAENDAFFVPLGARHELVTAALVRTAYRMDFRPKSVAVATSTGVLIRALQIAWPETEFHCVAVSRNLQEGEKGPANFWSSPLPFLKDTSYNMPFPSYANYDAKAFEYAVNNGVEAFWNVASKPVLKDKTIFDRISSNREWGDNNG